MAASANVHGYYSAGQSFKFQENKFKNIIATFQKPKWLMKRLSGRTISLASLAYWESCQKSTTELFYENSERLLVIKYYYKKPGYITDVSQDC